MQGTNDIFQLKESLSTSQIKSEWFLPRLFTRYTEDQGIFDFFLWQDFEARYCNTNINWDRWNTEDGEEHPHLKDCMQKLKNALYKPYDCL